MIGIQTTSFVAILGAAGLAVGLALQGSLSNFAGGVLILIFKPYKVGDTIDAMGQSGKVKEILIFNTILSTAENKNVILPNGAIANGTIVNHSKEAHLLVNIQIALPITSNFEAVKSIALAIMQANPKVLNSPAPSVSLSKINVDHLLIAVKPCTIVSDASSASNEILEALQQQLQAKGLAFN
jgi:small conductance mechanosensitive channel